MELGHITSLTTSGTVGSRFVTQDELDDAKKAKEDEWKAAYERLGQEPPPMPEEQEYDPRSLFEKLSSQKEIKKEEWDDKMRMANQWRGLEADEIAFLRDAADEQKEKERSIKRQEMEELAAFKMRQVQTQNAMPGPSTSPSQPTSSSSASKPTAKPAAPAKKGVKGLLRGVVVKKKDSTAKPPIPASPSSTSESPAKPIESVVPPVSPPPMPPVQTVATATPAKPLPVRIGFAAANEAPKRKRIGLATDYGSSSDEASADEAEADSKKQKTNT